MTSKFRKTRAGLLVVNAVFMCAIWGVVIFWAYFEHDRVIESNRQVLLQLRSSLEEQTAGLFRTLEMSLFASERWIADHQDEDPATSPEFIRLVDGLRLLSGNIVDIRMITPDGGLKYIPALKKSALADVSDREYFKAQLDEKTRGFYISSPVVSRVTKEWLVPVSIPVTVKSGYAAVLFGAIEHACITPLHEEQRLKPGGSIALLRSDGLVMFRTPFDERIIGMSFADKPEFMEYILKKEEGSFIYDGNGTDGVKRLICFKKLDHYPLVITVTASMKDVLAPWKKQSLVIFSLCTVLSLVVGGLWIYLMNTIRAKEASQASLEYLAKMDGLTGLKNRRAFLDTLKKEMDRSHRYMHRFSILMIDVDHFKKINDTFGHAAGDEMLKALAGVLCAGIRGIDTAGRIGGEEFCVLFPETELETSVAVAERIRDEFSKIMIKTPTGEISTTISIGVAELGKTDISPEIIMERADRGLYLAKDKGRNRVEYI